MSHTKKAKYIVDISFKLLKSDITTFENSDVYFGAILLALQLKELTKADVKVNVFSAFKCLIQSLSSSSINGYKERGLAYFVQQGIFYDFLPKVSRDALCYMLQNGSSNYSKVRIMRVLKQEGLSVSNQVACRAYSQWKQGGPCLLGGASATFRNAYGPR